VVGADERDARLLARGGEVGVLGEEAVAGVDRVSASSDGRGNDAGDIEVGAYGVSHLTDLVGLVGLQPVLAEPVLEGEDRHGGDPELGGGTERPHRDLATVGHQNLAEHASPRGRAPGGSNLPGDAARDEGNDSSGVAAVHHVK